MIILYIEQANTQLNFNCWATAKLVPSQIMPASSAWTQLWIPNPLWLQSVTEGSNPKQWTSSSQIWPVPCPKAAFWRAARAPPQPNCLHTTLASFKSQASSHTVPQRPLWSNSTLPEQRSAEFTSRTGERAKGEKSKVSFVIRSSHLHFSLPHK